MSISVNNIAKTFCILLLFVSIAEAQDLQIKIIWNKPPVALPKDNVKSAYTYYIKDDKEVLHGVKYIYRRSVGKNHKFVYVTREYYSHGKLTKIVSEEKQRKISEPVVQKKPRRLPVAPKK
jgi:hypothetical protein